MTSRKSKYGYEGNKINKGRVKQQFSRFQQIVWLEYMGVRSNRIPKNFASGIELMQELIEAQPERAQSGYEAIVLHKVPEGIADTSMKDIEAAFYGMSERIANAVKEDKIAEEASKVMAGMREELTNYGKKVLAEAAENYRPLVIKQGKKSKKVEGVLPKEFEIMIQLGSQRIPQFLSGPAGCGKTYLCSKLAEALDARDYADQSCSEGVDESTFMGKLLPIGAGGKFVYVQSPFIDIFENGGVFLFDEIDAADPNLMVFLNKALANEEIFVPQRYENPRVKKHPDFIAVAAANTYGNGADAMYVGRNQLDAATMDRFRAGMITMDYSKDVETKLSNEEVYTWCIKVRKAIRKHNLRRVMSTRTMLNLTKMKESCEWGEQEWSRSFFADWSEEERNLVMADLAPDLSDFVSTDAGNRATSDF